MVYELDPPPAYAHQLTNLDDSQCIVILLVGSVSRILGLVFV